MCNKYEIITSEPQVKFSMTINTTVVLSIINTE